MYRFILSFIIITGCGKKTPPVNIYDSDEYKNLTRKEIIVGESIWATACFRCHRYGTNGAVVFENKAYWDQAATKGLEELYNSVWEGKKGEMAQCLQRVFAIFVQKMKLKNQSFTLSIWQRKFKNLKRVTILLNRSNLFT